jgi:hypothetical protein
VQPQLGPGLSTSPAPFAKSFNTVVLSDTAWRTIFAADRKILGKIVQMNGQPYTVTGVMPRGFAFPFDSQSPQVWSPLSLTTKDQVRNHDTPTYNVIARLFLLTL